MVIKGYPSSTTSNVIAFLLQFRKFEIPCHRFIPNSGKNPLFSPRDCSELRGGTKERHARSPIPRSSRHSSIRQISFTSIDPLSFCNFILRNLSYSSASNRIEASLVCNTHANTRHVGRRSLLRFNGCIKLIQIYIPGPIHARKRDARTSWQGAVDPPLPSSLPLLTTLLLHCVSVYTRGCGFIIRREREGERGSGQRRRYIVFAREGGAERTRERAVDTAHLLPRAMGPPLCVARPDFRPIPRRVDSKRKRVRRASVRLAGIVGKVGATCLAGDGGFRSNANGILSEFPRAADRNSFLRLADFIKISLIYVCVCTSKIFPLKFRY